MNKGCSDEGLKSYSDWTSVLLQPLNLSTPQPPNLSTSQPLNCSVHETAAA